MSSYIGKVDLRNEQVAQRTREQQENRESRILYDIPQSFFKTKGFLTNKRMTKFALEVSEKGLSGRFTVCGKSIMLLSQNMRIIQAESTSKGLLVQFYCYEKIVLCAQIFSKKSSNEFIASNAKDTEFDQLDSSTANSEWKDTGKLYPAEKIVTKYRDMSSTTLLQINLQTPMTKPLVNKIRDCAKESLDIQEIDEQLTISILGVPKQNQRAPIENKSSCLIS